MINFPIDPEDYDKAYCSAWVATAIAGSAVVGGIAKAYAANAAADVQKAGGAAASGQLMEAAKNAIGVLDSYHNLAKGNFDIYKGIGQLGVDQLTSRINELTSPIPVSQEQKDLQKPLEFTQEQLEKLPGYKFASEQGLKATQNSAAARGLGVSGAALKGAATFSKGLADKTFADYFGQEQQNRQNAFGRYQTVWQDQLTGQQSAYDRLKGLIDTGANAAAGSAAVDTRFGSDIAKTATDAGKGVAGNTVGASNAEAAGINATGGAISDIANSVGGAAAYKGLYGNSNPSGNPTGWNTNPWSSQGQAWVPTFR